MSTNSRADVPEDYKPGQIAVQIVNAEGETVEETEDWKLWQNKSIELPVGTYTIKASSNGWDGQAAGFDIPYYTGSKEVTITAGGEVNETITCTLANVKVTVNFDKALLTKVRSVAATVDDDAVSNGASPTYSLSFESTETRSAYFPVSRLFANITVVNNEGASNSMRKELTDAEGNPVKAYRRKRHFGYCGSYYARIFVYLQCIDQTYQRSDYDSRCMGSFGILASYECSSRNRRKHRGHEVSIPGSFGNCCVG